VPVKLGAVLFVGVIAIAVPVAAQVKEGGPGNDALRGTAKADKLFGRGGADALKGRGGKDRLLGGGGADLLVGGRGRDTLNPGKGVDGVNMRDGAPIAAPGRDVIRARDGSTDQINCGDGRDRVFMDEVEDGVYDCEELIEP
jgi:RTX calcium-binding nonapeptide repeat (4 copies)